MNATVITTVFAPDLESETVARECMTATEAAFPTDPKLFAVDIASPSLERRAVDAGWQIIRLSDGVAPRMRRLLTEAFHAAATDLIWTIEMDAAILPGSRQLAEQQLQSDSRIAGVECCAVNLQNKGRMTEPTHLRALQSPNWPDPGARQCTGIALNCCVWRREALAQVDWSVLPIFAGADGAIDRQLAARGWIFLVSLTARVHHYRSISSRAFVRWRHARQ